MNTKKAYTRKSMEETTYFEITQNKALYFEERPTHLSEDGFVTLCGVDVDSDWWVTNSKASREVSTCAHCLIKSRQDNE